MLLVGIGSGLGGYYYATEQEKDDKAALQEQIDKLEQEVGGGAEISGWRSYTDPDLRVSFKYPTSLGEIEPQTGEPSGKLLAFSNSSIELGSYNAKSEKEEEGRGGAIWDFAGYAEKSGTYLWGISFKDLREEMKILRVVQAANSKVLLIDRNFLPDCASEDFCLLDEGDTAGLVNLKGPIYKGMVIVNRAMTDSTGGKQGPGPVDSQTFEKMLKTITAL